jgi:hypothetical protein
VRNKKVETLKTKKQENAKRGHAREERKSSQQKVVKKAFVRQKQEKCLLHLRREGGEPSQLKLLRLARRDFVVVVRWRRSHTLAVHL